MPSSLKKGDSSLSRQQRARPLCRCSMRAASRHLQKKMGSLEGAAVVQA